jgi:hypothetical protein
MASSASSASSTQFQHEKLLPGFIRLAFIEPGTADEIVQCNVVQQQISGLDWAGRFFYNALSCAWGEASDVWTLRVQNEAEDIYYPLVVTNTLLTALRRFRHTMIFDNDLVWSDLYRFNWCRWERIPNRSREGIYERAVNITVWLGNEELLLWLFFMCAVRSTLLPAAQSSQRSMNMFMTLRASMGHLDWDESRQILRKFLYPQATEELLATPAISKVASHSQQRVVEFIGNKSWASTWVFGKCCSGIPQWLECIHTPPSYPDRYPKTALLPRPAQRRFSIGNPAGADFATWDAVNP